MGLASTHTRLGICWKSSRRQLWVERVLHYFPISTCVHYSLYYWEGKVQSDSHHGTSPLKVNTNPHPRHWESDVDWVKAIRFLPSGNWCSRDWLLRATWFKLLSPNIKEGTKQDSVWLFQWNTTFHIASVKEISTDPFNKCERSEHISGWNF